MLDRSLFTLLNGLHSPFWDGVMVFISRREMWFAAYLVLVMALGYHFQRKGWLLIPLIALTVGVADTVSSSVFKPLFHRLRPCHEPRLADTIRLLDQYGCGGQFGFISSHAANTAVLATVLWLVLPARFRVGKWLLVAWSALTGYSRVYLGAHYPGDVLAGWLLGVALGWGAVRVYRRLEQRWWPAG